MLKREHLERQFKLRLDEANRHQTRTEYILVEVDIYNNRVELNGFSWQSPMKNWDETEMNEAQALQRRDERNLEYARVNRKWVLFSRVVPAWELVGDVEFPVQRHEHVV
jgi:hypothetical protein